jgi:hypothetical protein
MSKSPVPNKPVNPVPAKPAGFTVLPPVRVPATGQGSPGQKPTGKSKT